VREATLETIKLIKDICGGVAEQEDDFATSQEMRRKMSTEIMVLGREKSNNGGARSARPKEVPKSPMGVSAGFEQDQFQTTMVDRRTTMKGNKGAVQGMKNKSAKEVTKSN
jgi:hypothetical protein